MRNSDDGAPIKMLIYVGALLIARPAKTACRDYLPPL